MRHELRLATLAAALGLVAMTARGDAPRPLAVKPWCGHTTDRVGFHLAFADGGRRTVINLTCHLGSGECTGAQLDLGAVDRGAPLGSLALTSITGARVVGRGPDGSLRIDWGAHAFAVHGRDRAVSFDDKTASCVE